MRNGMLKDKGLDTTAWGEFPHTRLCPIPPTLITLLTLLSFGQVKFKKPKKRRKIKKRETLKVIVYN